MQRKSGGQIGAVDLARWLVAGVLSANVPAAAMAQPLQGSVLTQAPGDVFNHNTGLDPLRGQPEITPTTIGLGGSRCIPLNPSWQLIQQNGNTCYWYAPFRQPLQDYVVVPMSQVAGIEH